VSVVRCRFAPAPSGSIHVGNARTGLFSWLYARHHGGTFVLRVEDTDASRATEEAYQGTLDSLRWLGLDWDEGPDVGGPHAPYRQSERREIYREQLERLTADGRAYRCYCTPEELEERRVHALERGDPPGYDGRCRRLTDAERAAFEDAGRPFAYRFAMPEREQLVDDLVKGEVRFAPGSLRDFVIVRSDGSPTFLLAVAVDDLLMGITHVIRGDDLLASAPRNAAVIEALGGAPPRYAHLPQVLGADRKPLSKRHGSSSVEAFREQGFLAEALMNYLALLGWSYDDETTFFSRDELVERFDLDRVSSNPAAFDVEKLEWMNTHYIQRLGDDELAARVLPFLAGDGLLVDDVALLRAAMPHVRERMKTLAQATDLLRFLFTDDLEPSEKARSLMAKAGPEHLAAAADALERARPWTLEGVTAALDGLQHERGLSRTKAWQPVRAAVTGSEVSPPLDASIHLLGKERSVGRLRAAAAALISGRAAD
jgi:glutamyl-tRNA synthetase